MERNLTTDVIVLASRRWGELHRLVTLLSPSIGVFDAVVYGARKGKLAAGMELCSIGTCFLYHNRVRKEYSVVDIELLFDPTPIKEDLVGVYVAHAMAELAMRMHGGDFRELFDLLSEHVRALGGREADPRRVLIQFIWRFVGIMGLEPDLGRCPVCSKVYGERDVLSFHTAMHTPCCTECADIDPEGFELALGPGARRYLELTRTLGGRGAIEVPLSETATQRLFRYMVRYVTNILGSPLRSLSGGVLMEALQ